MWTILKGSTQINRNLEAYLETLTQSHQTLKVALLKSMSFEPFMKSAYVGFESLREKVVLIVVEFPDAFEFDSY
jgi:Na+-translocating ferredoxin:NAD+ oxidoreductase RnfA subunit